MLTRLFIPIFCLFLPTQCLIRKIAKINPLTSLNVVTFTPYVKKEPFKNVETIEEICNKVSEHKLYNAALKLEDNIINVSFGIPVGIKGTIIINATGYAGVFAMGRKKHPGIGARSTYNRLKNRTIHTTCISFDNPTNYRKTFNFGQDEDQKYLALLYQDTISKNPDASIVLMGCCHSALTILNYLNNPIYNKNIKNVKAVILESPPTSFDDLLLQVGDNYLPKPFKYLLPYVAKKWFSSYKWEQETILNCSKINIPNNIPILIGYLNHDKVVNAQKIRDLAKKLKSICPNIYLFESNDTTLQHGKLGRDKEFQEVQNAFLKTYNTPNDGVLAQKGMSLLQKIKLNH